jgi:2-polyprenyl-3-methyl-5-hydroxy-6-metoxy-1,4-benzoquinol methylase
MLVYTSESRLALADGLVRAALGNPEGICYDIDSRDEMYLYSLAAAGGELDLAIAQYLQVGCEAAQIYGHLVAAALGSREAGVKILDFAGGYGRVTRFLPKLLPNAQIWASDILRPAVAFQVANLGVNGFDSQLNPEELNATEGFDAIFVTSLFTHLPDATFGRWLKKLYSLLNDTGVLLFTTLDTALASDRAESVAGILFEPESEIPSLDTADYGRTYVSEGYVGERVRSLAESGTEYHRFPRRLGGYQDINILSKNLEPNLRQFEPGLKIGCRLEDLHFRLNKGLVASGWAVALEPTDSVEVIEVAQGESVISRS